MTTLAQMIQELAHMVDGVEHEGTAEAATTTTLDDSMLVQGDDHWNDHKLYIYAGTGVGQERWIIDFATANDRLSIAPAFTVTPDATSKFIILKKGISVEQLRRAIILALRRRRRQLLTPKVDESVTLDMDPTATYEYTIPSGFVAIYEIHRESAQGSAQFTVPLPQDVWTVSKGTTRKLVFDKNLNDIHGFLTDSCKLRITGQAYPTEPTSDSNDIGVNTGSLLVLASALANQMFTPDDQLSAEQRRSLSAQNLQYYESIKWEDAVGVYPGSAIVEDL